jgi:hypothetical protein
MRTRLLTPNRGPNRFRISVLAVLALVVAGCTFTSGTHMEVDFLGARYRFYIYEKPTSQITVELRDVCRSSAGTSRRQWATCSLTFLGEHVEVPSIGQREWNIWTGSDQWDDYGGAVEAVIAGGYRMDSSGERYALTCLVGDHLGFQDYNWTIRDGDDRHCKRGTNA